MLTENTIFIGAHRDTLCFHFSFHDNPDSMGWIYCHGYNDPLRQHKYTKSHSHTQNNFSTFCFITSSYLHLHNPHDTSDGPSIEMEQLWYMLWCLRRFVSQSFETCLSMLGHEEAFLPLLFHDLQCNQHTDMANTFSSFSQGIQDSLLTLLIAIFPFSVHIEREDGGTLTPL